MEIVVLTAAVIIFFVWIFFEQNALEEKVDELQWDLDKEVFNRTMLEISLSEHQLSHRAEVLNTHELKTVVLADEPQIEYEPVSLSKSSEDKAQEFLDSVIEAARAEAHDRIARGV